MSIFLVENVHELNRKNSNVIYFSINNLHTLRNWNLPLLNTETINTDVVIVSYDNLVSFTSSTIQISNPIFLYPLPEGKDEDQYVVLFVLSEQYLAQYCEKVLLSYDFFSRLIEKKDKLSSHSTKLITLHTLQNILKAFNDLPINKELWPNFCGDFVLYLRSLTEKYPYLGYLPIAERKKFRNEYIADTGFAWRFYIQFFIEDWNPNGYVLRIPNLSKPFEFVGWRGDFFHRENPFWQSYLSANGQFRFNNAVSESIYQIWKEWITRA